MRTCRMLASCTILGALLLVPGPAGSQPSEPRVRIQRVLEPSVAVNSCVTPTQVTRSPGLLDLVRDGDLASELTVEFRTTGPVEPTVGTVVLPAGAATGTAELNAIGENPSAFEVQLVDGASYELGSPSTFQGGVAFATTSCAPETTVSTAPPDTLPRTGGSPDRPLTGSGALAVLAGSILMVLARRRAASRRQLHMRH